MGRVRGYLKNAAILTAAGLAIRAAGMLLRVYIAGQVGAEGMGLYQLVFTVYSLCSTFATAGVSVAATLLASEELTKGDSGCLLGVMAKVIRLGAVVGLLAGFIQFSLAYPISKFWLGDVRAETALKLLAPSLPFMAVSSAMRGYFLAKRQVNPGVKSQIFEQIVRMAIIFWLLPKVVDQPIGVACSAIVIGNTLSEAASCLLIAVYYKKDQCGTKYKKPPEGTLGRIWRVAAPVEGGRCMDSGLHTVENILVPACLLTFLGDRQLSLAQFGALKGMAMPLLLFPYSFLNPLSTLLLPEITEAHLLNHREQLERLVGRIMLFTNVFSVLAGGLIALNAHAIADILYHDQMVGEYLKVLGPVLPAMYLDSMGDAILKGMGEEMATFRYSLWDSILRIGLTLLLLPRYGMPGFLFMMLLSNLMSAILNIQRIHKVAHIPVRWYRWFIQPFLVFVISAVIADKLELYAPCIPRFPELVLKTVITAMLFVLILLPMGFGKELAALRKSKK